MTHRIKGKAIYVASTIFNNVFLLKSVTDTHVHLTCSVIIFTFAFHIRLPVDKNPFSVILTKGHFNSKGGDGRVINASITIQF